VFAQVLDRRATTGMYKTRRVTAFIEGNWLRDFQRIDREATEYRAHRRETELTATVAERARRFGINPENAGERPSLLMRILRALTFRSA
jgi:hypothetical protein